ncbi:Bestrophin, RFP-TM, chloride channel-domain-containing protein [Phlyctochytrium arcticum]|nr:Bestrophin, RFP-TM, chloride channel-domain-containing protein [Phlyctochytrium arcticum]
MDDKLTAILGASLAMLLAFRINRGFDRYWQGAQLWTTLAIQIRNMSRLVWNGINTTSSESYQEKLQIMKLLLGVAVATKYALRGENAFEQKELVQLLPAGYASKSYRSSLMDLGAVPTSPSSPVEDLFNEGDKTRKPMFAELDTRERDFRDMHRKQPSIILPRNRASISRQMSTLLSPSQSIPVGPRRYPFIRPFGGVSSLSDTLVINAPLDIIYRIGAYLRRQRGITDVEDLPSMTSAVNGMIDAVSKFEQILYIPMPKSYDTHLKQILMAYFVALPFQLVRQMGWLLIPVVFITSLAFFGADAIAGEIEDPFGTDENDLPIDYFCTRLRGDLEYIMEMVFDIDDEDDELPGEIFSEAKKTL